MMIFGWILLAVNLAGMDFTTSLSPDLYELKIPATQTGIYRQQWKTVPPGIFRPYRLFHKKHTMGKLQANYNKSSFTQQDTENKLQAQYLNTFNDWQNNKQNYDKKYNNFSLNEDVYNLTTDRYKEGMASMTELLKDDLRKSDARNGYLTAFYNLKLSELYLMKLTGKN